MKNQMELWKRMRSQQAFYFVSYCDFISFRLIDAAEAVECIQKAKHSSRTYFVHFKIYRTNLGRGYFVLV